MTPMLFLPSSSSPMKHHLGRYSIGKYRIGKFPIGLYVVLLLGVIAAPAFCQEHRWAEQLPHPSVSSQAGSAAKAQHEKSIYRPLPLVSGVEIEDTLTTQDIPVGQGSFARDYIIALKAGEQVAIDLLSENFDTVLTLMSANGLTLGENDDGPDGSTNSLLFVRIAQDGDYVVRVRGFGKAKGGAFKLKLTRLEALP